MLFQSHIQDADRIVLQRVPQTKPSYIHDTLTESAVANLIFLQLETGIPLTSSKSKTCIAKSKGRSEIDRQHLPVLEF